LNSHLWIFLIIFRIDERNSCSACGWAEYEIDGRCCPMCTPGYHVIEHCTASDMTLCRPCPESTFTDKPHGRRICNPCTTCNHGLGLKTVKECKPFSDAVCGVLEGNYCTDPYKGGCRAAQKHTTCKPGHFIKHPGTDSKDTVCESCPENSYSNGSSTSCTPHTDCESEGRPTVKTGDSVSDSVCGEKNLMPIVAGTTAGVILMVFLVQIGLRLYQLKCCQRETPPVCPVRKLWCPLNIKIQHAFLHKNADEGIWLQCVQKKQEHL
uniref:TNFR-Cys domain-containing protein n=1 Tax=Scleropages formosus TaxID=113540 RepID=A0A8C9TL27_SCLFO